MFILQDIKRRSEPSDSTKIARFERFNDSTVGLNGYTLNANINAFHVFRVSKENIRNMFIKESRGLIVVTYLLRLSLEEVRQVSFDHLKQTFLVATEPLKAGEKVQRRERSRY